MPILKNNSLLISNLHFYLLNLTILFPPQPPFQNLPLTSALRLLRTIKEVLGLLQHTQQNRDLELEGTLRII